MRGRIRPDWQAGKVRYMVHFLTGDVAMRLYDEPLDIGAVIESGRHEVWRVEQPSALGSLGRAWVTRLD